MKKFIAVLSVALLPVVASAQSVNTGYIDSIVEKAKGYIAMALPIIISLAVVYFVYNIFVYVVKADDEGRKAAKDHIIYGIVGLFVMVSVWGLVNVLSGILNVGDGGGVQRVPTLPIGNTR